MQGMQLYKRDIAVMHFGTETHILISTGHSMAAAWIWLDIVYTDR